MNSGNLKKIADYILTVPQEMFDIDTYRSGDCTIIECDSVGCIIGHSVILDPNPELIPIDKFGDINFDIWSEQFTGLRLVSPEWRWCFSSEWYFVDNTPTGASKRINWLLDHGLPKNWYEQMSGYVWICYI